jgi:transporter family protein
MTLGFLLSLAAGFVWSCVNVIDKAVVSKFIKNPIFMIVIFVFVSLVIGLITLPFLNGGLSGWDWGWILIASIAYTLGNLLYFYALKKEEPSRIIPLFSLTTVLVVMFSALFLGEVFGFETYFGIFVIITGSIIITAKKNILYSFTSRALWLMVLSCLGFSIAYVINKYLLDTYSYWQVFGWQRVIVGLAGIFIVFGFYSELKQVYQQIKKRYMALSASAEVLNVFGVLLFTIASAFWFVALVEAVVSVQYVFVFFWALIISRFKPSLFSEEVNKKIMLQKIVSIALIIVGIYLIT